MSIEHVDPLHATTLTLFSTLRHDDLLPRDIGVEIHPWLPTSRSATEPIPDQFKRIRDLKGWRSVRDYAGFSLGISQGIELPDASEIHSQIAFAARTFLIAGRLNTDLERFLNEYLDAVTKIKNAPPANANEAQAMEFLLRARRILQDISRISKNRVGFLLETGWAHVRRVPRNSLSQSRAARHAVWLTPIYRFERVTADGPVAGPDLAGIIRLLGERETESRVLDFGSRVGTRWRGIHYSLEGIGRVRFTDRPVGDDDLTYGRLVGGIGYGFNRSTLMNFTIGKNYSGNFSAGGSFSASFGVSIGLGEIPFGLD